MASIAALLTSDTPVSPLNHDFCFSSGATTQHDTKPKSFTLILNEQQKGSDAEIAQHNFAECSSFDGNFGLSVQYLSGDGMKTISEMQNVGRRTSNINKRLMEKEKGKLSVIFPRRKMGEASRKTDAVWLSMELVHSLSDRSLQEAAKHLGISATALKKACRVLGIERWPYCRKRIQDGDCSSSKDAQSPDNSNFNLNDNTNTQATQFSETQCFGSCDETFHKNAAIVLEAARKLQFADQTSKPHRRGRRVSQEACCAAFNVLQKFYYLETCCALHEFDCETYIACLRLSQPPACLSPALSPRYGTPPARLRGEQQGSKIRCLAPYRSPQMRNLATTMARTSCACWAHAGVEFAPTSRSLLDLAGARGSRRGLVSMRCSLSLPNERSVVLLSGGVESVTLLHLLSARMGSKLSETNLIPLFLDYAQKGAEMERRASQSACDRLGLELVELDARSVGEGIRRRQKQRLHVPIPHRNLFALSIALAVANVEGAKKMHIAIQQDDTDWYPSASRGFLAGCKNMIGLLEPEVELLAPFLDMTKQQVLELGVGLGVDYSRTYSCIRGGENHCGTCKQCRERRKSFESAGISEPLGFYEK
eukprot:753656-Hanusia_phi.AAC.20